ncbi:hypothetical protein TVAG_103480 [Trichomonas vaginalis G3]|uniref:Uncharacterized protein n=1 Tax=Trichomonas vaginalis (strain ATCC PRA-98 / G3) TaxID=412133 RepID=A2EKQ9_TRIV3|nr:hypothetical protein TVAGG3_0931130 [Trichomonas vaginalis G3]EAY06798.1 hypothetical protein TVAG_103480 [Trichomonas vaginalis G3]KAI5485842.1 hypothetical protein TVAGG3_0931130 [Trichomonas vaginalis G3]|eukprot:XP_001319021.1 hypothetical protein [Trichomonas vaginalis G3]
MLPTFYGGDDNDTHSNAIPPLPIGLIEESDSGFQNFANSTQRGNSLFSNQKKSQRLLPEPEIIGDVFPSSQRKNQINPILIQSPRIREDSNRIILENGDSYMGPSDSTRSGQDSYMGPSDSYLGPSDSTRSGQNSYVGPSDSYLGPSDTSTSKIGWQYPYAQHQQSKKSNSSFQNSSANEQYTNSFAPANAQKFDFNDPNFLNGDVPHSLFEPVKMDSHVPDLPTPSATPTRLVQSVRVRAMKQEIEQASKMWMKRINDEEQKQKEQMKQLIAGQVQELRTFDERNGILPRAVSALPPTLKMICSNKNKALVRVPISTTRGAQRKPLSTPRQNEQESSKRKMILARHQKEVIAANNECNQRLSAMRYQMERDIERRCQELSSLSGFPIDYREFLVSQQTSSRNIADGKTYHLIIKLEI